ncbi:hypothetical protein EPO14_01100 [Patescibacteria group bacterium]|nr:MAG: hypothetical protein EPO14_01100 [Patescibacteria group bacterium]
MSWKTLVLFALIFAFIGDLGWTLVYWFGEDLSDLDNKLLGIRSGISHLSVVALYIAWRVTPESSKK